MFFYKLSINPIPIVQQQNKGKPSGKELKKLYQALDKVKFDQYFNNPNIPKAEKMETVIREATVKAMEIFNESTAKKMLDKFMKKL